MWPEKDFRSTNNKFNTLVKMNSVEENFHTFANHTSGIDSWGPLDVPQPTGLCPRYAPTADPYASLRPQDFPNYGAFSEVSALPTSNHLANTIDLFTLGIDYETEPVLDHMIGSFTSGSDSHVEAFQDELFENQETDDLMNLSSTSSLLSSPRSTVGSLPPPNEPPSHTDQYCQDRLPSTRSPNALVREHIRDAGTQNPLVKPAVSTKFVCPSCGKPFPRRGELK